MFKLFTKTKCAAPMYTPEEAGALALKNNLAAEKAQFAAHIEAVNRRIRSSVALGLAQVVYSGQYTTWGTGPNLERTVADALLAHFVALGWNANVFTEERTSYTSMKYKTSYLTIILFAQDDAI